METPQEMKLELALVSEGKKAVFVAKLPPTLPFNSRVQEALQNHWRKTWENGSIEPPALLILPYGIEITALTDAELHDYGLMKIPVNTE